jgi:hypothetical protein
MVTRTKLKVTCINGTLLIIDVYIGGMLALLIPFSITRRAAKPLSGSWLTSPPSHAQLPELERQEAVDSGQTANEMLDRL